MHNYNTVQGHLTLKEYGRNVQKLVDHLLTIEDKEERNRKAQTMVDMMKLINPAAKETTESNQKLWDDLHIISGFKLDIEGPFPTPSREILEKKPQRVPYSANDITFKHFGKNIELLVDKAITLEDAEEKEAAIIHIGKLMKTFFYSYNKDVMEDHVVYTNIRKLSNNQLEIDMEKVKAGDLFEPQKKDKRNIRNQSTAGNTPGDRPKRNNNANGSNGNNRRNNFKRKRN
ncbi:DUF4290 domain-containing protein [Reichenbachiella agarivorans]|uniref:DUF4290 domain-containing protein n=1 Tax=Reichenbachiella agarivorans TaxID=2979464 RepID=A0ABY6CQC8_9BACT|nr:DUF4290 domain-containing protein [Reichenbachiella agarivorans]UXP32712.1 DUF4290 domain-containing protein [Reichenbachiella agarivorans]